MLERGCPRLSPHLDFDGSSFLIDNLALRVPARMICISSPALRRTLPRVLEEGADCAGKLPGPLSAGAGACQPRL